MGKADLETALFALTLERGAGTPLHAQLSAALRGMILSGAARPGATLPPSRALAAELSVSRLTVQTALDQLAAEGFVEGRVGSGVRVAADLPEEGIAAPSPAPAALPPEPPPGAPPFRPAAPDLSLFPHAAFARRLERAWRAPEPGLLAPPDPAGWPPLRAALARHLSAWRGLDVDAGRLFVTSGAAESMRLLARAGFAPGDEIIAEAPGYPPAFAALRAAGLRLRLAPADENGLDVDAALASAPRAKGALLSPSRHYPTGATLPLARRLRLLDWAAATGATVIEDDYDGEFRYRGRPLPALAALDRAGRVVYAGSLSKTLAPGLRIAFLAAPDRLAAPILAEMRAAGGGASLIPQPALAGFIEAGEFAAHLRRMRRTYAQRQTALLSALEREGAGLLEAEADPSGMHLVARLSPALAAIMNDREASARAAAAGVEAPALSAYWPDGAGPQGLLLGYAGWDEATLAAAAARLIRALAAPATPAPPAPAAPRFPPFPPRGRGRGPGPTRAT